MSDLGPAGSDIAGGAPAGREVRFRKLALLMCAVGVWTLAWSLVAIDARATYGARVSSDEPQYLTTALSLAEDFNLDISDEIAERSFLPYHEINLNTQTRPLNDDGQRLSPHDPLLPLMLAAPMRIGGWAAAKAALAAIAGVTAATTLWLAVRRFGVRPRLAAAVVAAFFSTPPLVSYGSQIYPEMPAALFATLGLAAVTGTLGTRSRVLAALSVIALPWLSVKYIPVAAVLAVVVIVRLWRRHTRPQRWMQVGVELAVLGVAGALYFWFRQRTYGGWTVYAAGDHFTVGELTVVGRRPNYLGRTRRLVGLLADREFGLIAWMPAYVLLPAAMTMLVRLRPPRWLVAGTFVAMGFAVATWVAFTMHGWWWPGRQLVVVLPAAVAVIAFATQRLWALRWVVVGSWPVAAMGWVWLAVEASVDRRTLIVDFAETPNPWYRMWSTLLPDYQAFDRIGSVALHWGWAFLLIASAAVAWFRLGRSRDLTSEPADELAPDSNEPSVSGPRTV